MEFLDTKQAADLLGVTSAYVREMINKGEIKAKKIGNSFRIPKEEVNKILGISEKEEQSKDLLIAELKNKVEHLEMKLTMVANLLNTINSSI